MLNFLKRFRKKSVQKVFIDCGFHHGEGLMKFIQMLEIDATWMIETFEPNPACHMGRRLQSPAFMNYKINPHREAVWITDGVIQFSQENHVASGSGSPTDHLGNNLDGWCSSVASLGSVMRRHETVITVPCVSLVDFINRFTRVHTHTEIYLKMDIEGAEFQVLRHLLDNPKTLKKIKTMWVEFHERFISTESELSKRELVEQLQNQGIEIFEWI